MHRLRLGLVPLGVRALAEGACNQGALGLGSADLDRSTAAQLVRRDIEHDDKCAGYVTVRVHLVLQAKGRMWIEG